MIKTICYISSISTTSSTEINSLNEFVLKKNKALNITGVLIVQNGHFFQIMEGEKDTIEKTYNKIKEDKRHSGIIKLLDTNIEDRLFQDYESGHFSVIKDFSKLKKLKIYFDWIKQANILVIDELVLLTSNFLKYNT
ncbi:MAG: BLUF domain-containing protein [Olleya sp.]